MGETMPVFPTAGLAEAMHEAARNLRPLVRSMRISLGESAEKVDAEMAAQDRRTEMWKQAELNARSVHAANVGPDQLAPWESQWPSWREARIAKEYDRLAGR